MKRSPALDVLIRLADESRDAAAGSLGVAVGVAQTAEQKLELLQRYRDEYAARFQTRVSAGLTASGFCNLCSNSRRRSPIPSVRRASTSIIN